MVTDNNSKHLGENLFDIIVTYIVPCILILLNFVMIGNTCVIVAGNSVVLDALVIVLLVNIMV